MADNFRGTVSKSFSTISNLENETLSVLNLTKDQKGNQLRHTSTRASFNWSTSLWQTTGGRDLSFYTRSAWNRKIGVYHLKLFAERFMAGVLSLLSDGLWFPWRNVPWLCFNISRRLSDIHLIIFGWIIIAKKRRILDLNILR